MAVISDPEASSFSPVKVLVADSSEAWRSCVAVLFAEHPEIRLLGFETNGIDALKQTRELSPDFLLIDTSMPGMNGIEVAKSVRGTNELRTKVMIVSMNRNRDVISCALSNGAFGYIHKFDFAAEFMTAISAALRNSIYVSTEIQSIIAGSD